MTNSELHRCTLQNITKLVSNYQKALSSAPCASRYSKKLLDDEDNALRASECAGQRAALLDAAQAEEGAHQVGVTSAF